MSVDVSTARFLIAWFISSSDFVIGKYIVVDSNTSTSCNNLIKAKMRDGVMLCKCYHTIRKYLDLLHTAYRCT